MSHKIDTTGGATPPPVPPPLPKPAPAVVPPVPAPVMTLSWPAWVAAGLLLFLLAGDVGLHVLPYVTPAPVPAPPLPPAPTPPVTPVVLSTVALHATLVYDSAGTTPHATGADIAAAGTGGPVAALQALNCGWRAVDKGSPLLTNTGLAAYVTKAGGPPVLIVQADGMPVPLIVQPSPTDAASVVAVVQKIRGTK